jgi:transposase, IS5 family
MYRRSTPGQLSFENFYLPFGGKLSPDNRWVKLAALIPWEAFEAEYAAQLSAGMGAPAKSFRIALGALIIKEKLGTSDRETVEQIRENPYLQYFLGFSEYSDAAPFDDSMMVHFRQRLNLEWVGRINEAVVPVAPAVPPPPGGNIAPAAPAPKSGADDDEPPASGNQGQLIMDASCPPADIRYPTDLSLLNEAREHSEAVINVLYNQVSSAVKKKPRTYRQQARREYLKVSKQHKVNCKTMRKAIGKQLNYVRRNLGHIDALIAAGASLSELDRQAYRKLLVVSELFRQQQQMYETKQHRVDDRIVSLSQPHVRPIVRGKAGTPVEFGAKIAVSCVAGYVFLDRLSWDNFNESGDLPQQVERFKQRFGHYPESVHADQIDRTRANRKYCRERGIRLSGPPLGRPAVEETASIRKQAQADANIRNQIEGKFGQGKRRFSLARVMAKLAPTAETSIAITFLLMNLERRLTPFILRFLVVLSSCRSMLCLKLHRPQSPILPMTNVLPLSAQNRCRYLNFCFISG